MNSMTRDLAREVARERRADARHRGLVKEVKRARRAGRRAQREATRRRWWLRWPGVPVGSTTPLTAAPAPRPEDVAEGAGDRARRGRGADRRARDRGGPARPPRPARRHPLVRTRCSRCPGRLGRSGDRATARLRCSAWCGAVRPRSRGPSMAARPAPGWERPGAGRLGSREQCPELRRPPARGLPPRAVGRPSHVRRWHPDGGRNDLAERARHEPVGGGGRPPARAPDDRVRRRQSLPVPQPQELGTARLPAPRQRPPTRFRLASLLFAEADDPLRALRWCLAEVRRGLGPGAVLDDDPVQLTLPPGASFDVDVLVHGHWNEALQLPGLGQDLLDGVAIAPRSRSSPGCCPAPAPHGSGGVHHPRGGPGADGPQRARTARDLAVRATAMSPLDENHQALLIRVYRLAGDDDAAARQYAAWSAPSSASSARRPGRSAAAAARGTRLGAGPTPSRSTRSPRPVRPRSRPAPSRPGSSRSNGGTAGRPGRCRSSRVRDAAGAGRGTDPLLRRPRRRRAGGPHEAERIAMADGDPDSVARARAELGYVDFLRARYDRAERLLTGALAAEEVSPSVRAKATTYLGSVASDRADYARATALLEAAARLSRAVASRVARPSGCRCSAGSVSCAATSTLRTSTSGGDRLAERGHWLSFLPWPQALLGRCSWPGATRSGGRAPRAVVRTGLPDRRPLLGGHLGPRAGAALRGHWRARPGHHDLLDARSAPTGWLTPTCGSTSTSWTLSARWVAATGTR